MLVQAPSKIFHHSSSTYLVVRYKNGGHTIQNMPMKIQDHNRKGLV